MSIEIHDGVFIDGAFVPSRTPTRIDLVDPATEEVFARVPDADGEDVDAAVRAAARAFPAWRETTAQQRADLLLAVADGIESRAEEMIDLLMRANGATRAWAAYVGPGSAFIYRGWAQFVLNAEREEIRTGPAGHSIYQRDPLGVVAAIVPWNSPQVLLASKVAPALAAGCTVVAKPSPETTLDTFLLAEIMRDAGVPAGVFNAVSGGRGTGAALVAHEGVDMVSFTGSTPAGRMIASVCGEQLKPVSAELGGKSAVVVLEDADMAVIEQLLFAEILPYSGQVCYVCSRVLVHESRFDEVLGFLRDRLADAKVGAPTDPDTVFGPLVSSAARDKVEALIASALEQGATLVLGGGRPADLTTGYYVEPTIFVDVTADMRIFQEEIFGPVLMVVPFGSDDEAVALANDSEYGLAGNVVGRDVEHATSVARRLDTGRVLVNGARGYGRAAALYKASGLGRVGDMDTLDLYCNVKNITQPA